MGFHRCAYRPHQRVVPSCADTSEGDVRGWDGDAEVRSPGRWPWSSFGVTNRSRTMNRYGTMAMKHWAKWLPQRYTQIENPQTFSTDLGQQIEDQVIDLAATMQANQAPEPNYRISTTTSRCTRRGARGPGGQGLDEGTAGGVQQRPRRQAGAQRCHPQCEQLQGCLRPCSVDAADGQVQLHQALGGREITAGACRWTPPRRPC